MKIDSTVLEEPNRAWFSVSEEPFASEAAAQMAVQDAVYQFGVKLATKLPDTLPSDIIIEKA